MESAGGAPGPCLANDSTVKDVKMRRHHVLAYVMWCGPCQLKGRPLVRNGLSTLVHAVHAPG